NITTKCYGSRNPINVVKATMNALESLRTLDQVAAMRGKTVDEIL
ncbi:MAG: 30S ribosomal protein S5, partial [Clostridiales bacterium]|nr:30S ribosomal protein S5 [Clostridiales bacterium]